MLSVQSHDFCGFGTAEPSEAQLAIRFLQDKRSLSPPGWCYVKEKTLEALSGDSVHGMIV